MFLLGLAPVYLSNQHVSTSLISRLSFFCFLVPTSPPLLDRHVAATVLLFLWSYRTIPSQIHRLSPTGLLDSSIFRDYKNLDVALIQPSSPQAKTNLSTPKSQYYQSWQHFNPSKTRAPFPTFYPTWTIFCFNGYGLRGVEPLGCYYFQAEAWTWKLWIFRPRDSLWGARYAGHNNCSQEFKGFIARFSNTQRIGVNDCQTSWNVTSGTTTIDNEELHQPWLSCLNLQQIYLNMQKISMPLKCFNHLSAVRVPPTPFPYRQIYR